MALMSLTWGLPAPPMGPGALFNLSLGPLVSVSSVVGVLVSSLATAMFVPVCGLWPMHGLAGLAAELSCHYGSVWQSLECV